MVGDCRVNRVCLEAEIASPLDAIQGRMALRFHQAIVQVIHVLTQVHHLFLQGTVVGLDHYHLCAVRLFFAQGLDFFLHLHHLGLHGLQLGAKLFYRRRLRTQRQRHYSDNGAYRQ